jgi:thiamine pyrophosphate-dependent acetolactate synthase large subunit-like protein
VKVFEALAQGLTDHDASTMFGLMGDGNLFFADAYARRPGTRYVSATHEAAAVMMANGYASVSGRLGVVTVTHGPGLANALPPVIDSVRGGIPLLIVAGDTAADDRKTLQKIPQRELVLPTGAGFEAVRTPETAVHDLATAMRRALLERRPVVLNVPVDFMSRDVDYERVELGLPGRQAVGPDPEALDRAVGLLAQARRPLVLAGRGASHARAALLRLAERIGAPVATTLRGTSLFRGEPFNLGIYGTLSSPAALEAIGRSDCVLTFGAGLNPWTTDSGRLLTGKRVIQCDIDPAAVGRNRAPDASVVGDAATVADAVVAWLDEGEIPPSGFRTAALAAHLAEDQRRSDWRTRPADEPADFASALSGIDELVPEARTLVVDAGRFMFEGYKLVHAPDPHSLVHTCNWGSIGLGMGNALGAAVAAPDRPVLLLCGDGGFMMGGLAEFSSAVRHALDLVVVVVNDRSYGAEHIQFRNRGLDPTITTFDWPDLAALAVALGGSGVTVRTAGDLAAVERAIADRDRPLLIDLVLDPDTIPYE